ncbi:unnamed protein product [Mytilus coruscus]|uniref:DZIP3-like HEPN domain-containing protein n=1 Tax=Mytilus coruscus TaxID=42192 RepID=A0A6J8DKV4_MYTCO|nr:unnamed protein product [Mytilus coruscus]
MLSKSRIWNCNFVLILLVLQTAVLYIESYEFKCPSQASWRLRAHVKCNSTMKYFCLYNNVAGKYVEGCDGPDWDRKGSKRIHAGDFSRGKCTHKRFQPFSFWTNGSMTDCVYEKSLCSEAGQIVYRDISTKDDRSCQCDFKQKYEVIKTPNNVCFCIPTEEDCSCYHTAYSTNSPISADNSCTNSGIKENQNQNRTDVIISDKNLAGKTEKERIPLRPAIAGGFFITVLFSKWTSEKMQSFEKYLRRNNTAGGQQLKEEEHHSIGNNKPTTDEVNFLRIVHLLVNVACPVVRIFFNNEIKPDQLRKTLDKNKQEMVKRYRKKDTIINDSQWYLLFGPGRTVTSDDFDIKLMILLLSTLANIMVSDLYPVYFDTSIVAMLSRIQFISNETFRNFEGQLSVYTFNKYWDDIGQQNLLYNMYNVLHIYNLFLFYFTLDRLLVVNPINIDAKLLRTFIHMSESYPGLILQQLISEYCASKSITIEDLLKKNKHKLYHKRIKNEPCCLCPTVSNCNRVISEKQWKTLYRENECSCFHSYSSSMRKQCIERFTPKMNNTLELSASKAMILHIPTILAYMIDRLNIKDCSLFLMHNQHVIYHSMEGKMCCKCCKVPAEKIIINIKQWNKLFKQEETISCRIGTRNCCCQYSVRNGIKFTDVDHACLSKIFTIAGPIGVLNKIEQNALLYFLNWTADKEPLQRMLTDLLSMIEDKTLNVSISSRMPMQSEKTTAQQSDLRRWIDDNVQKREATTEQQLQILIRDEDVLYVRSVLVPKDFSPPLKIKKFTDLTVDESNYLVVVHGLTKIVHPIIKKEFNTQCPDHVLNAIRLSISEWDMVSNRRKVGTKSQKERIYLTPDQQRQLFSQSREESENLDLELMIYILKKRSNFEWNKVYIDQLEVIEHIRREIVQSSSGTLTQKRFHDMLNCLTKAVLHLGGETSIEKLLRLHHIENILE